MSSAVFPRIDATPGMVQHFTGRVNLDWRWGGCIQILWGPAPNDGGRILRQHRLPEWFQAALRDTISNASRWGALVLPEIGNDFAGGWGAFGRNHFRVGLTNPGRKAPTGRRSDPENLVAPTTFGETQFRGTSPFHSRLAPAIVRQNPRLLAALLP